MATRWFEFGTLKFQMEYLNLNCNISVWNTTFQFKCSTLILEAVVRRCSSKYIFLKMSLISQGPVLGSLLNKVAGH